MLHARSSYACILGLLAAAATAQQGKPNFSGKWQLNAEKSQLAAGKASAVNLTIEQKGPTIHILKTIKSADGKESVTEFTCTTDGKDCDAKGVKVSLWYDGPSLIQMDVSDALIAKTSMTLSEDGNTITLTVTYMSPQAEADKFVVEKKM
jgi:hypothetical protein